MSVKVQLPPGCEGFRMQDGTSYGGREGAHVTVSDDHAAAIERTNGGDAGLVRAAGQVFAPVGTPGRVCTGCGRTWYPWSKTCPRQACGAATVPE